MSLNIFTSEVSEIPFVKDHAIFTDNVESSIISTHEISTVESDDDAVAAGITEPVLTVQVLVVQELFKAHVSAEA
jgi:hypothetical protein